MYKYLHMSENNCCSLVEKVDDFWEQHKYKISGKFSIGLSVLAGVASILSIKFIIPAGIILGVTNVGVFFAGLSLERFGNEHRNLAESNESLKNEKTEMIRRFTTYQFQQSEGASQTPRPSNTSTQTNYEEMVSFTHLNGNFASLQPTEPFAAFSDK